MCKSFPLSIFPNKERQREINALAVFCPVNLVSSKEKRSEGHVVKEEKGRSKDSPCGDANNRRIFSEAGKSDQSNGSNVCDWKGELGQLESHLTAKHAGDKRFRVKEKDPTPASSRPRRSSLDEWFNTSLHAHANSQRRRRLTLPDLFVDDNTPWRSYILDYTSDEESSDEMEESSDSLRRSYAGGWHRANDPIYTAHSSVDITVGSTVSEVQFNPTRPENLPENPLERSFSELGLLNRAPEYVSSSSQWGDDSERSDVEEALEEVTVPSRVSHDASSGNGSGLWSLRTLRRRTHVVNPSDGDHHLSVADRPPTPHTSVSDLPSLGSYHHQHVLSNPRQSHASHRQRHRPAQRLALSQPRPQQSRQPPVQQQHNHHHHQQRHHHRRSCPVHCPPCPVHRPPCPVHQPPCPVHHQRDNSGTSGGHRNNNSSGSGTVDWNSAHHHHHRHPPQPESAHALPTSTTPQQIPPSYVNPPPLPHPSHPAAMYPAAAYPDGSFYSLLPHQWPPPNHLPQNPPPPGNPPPPNPNSHYTPIFEQESINNMYMGPPRRYHTAANPLIPTTPPPPPSIFWQELGMSTSPLSALLDPSHMGRPPPHGFTHEEAAAVRSLRSYEESPGRSDAPARPGTPFAGF